MLWPPLNPSITLALALALAAIPSIAQAAQASNSNTFSNPPLAPCGISCLTQLTSVLGCDPSLLSCACPALVAYIPPALNTPFQECLESYCSDDDDASDFGVAMGENCGYTVWPSTSVVLSTPVTFAPAPVTTFPAGAGATNVPAGATTVPAGAATASASGPRAGSSTGTTAPTKTPNAAAAQSGCGRAAALGVALAAALAW